MLGTYIITSIAVSPKGRFGILAIMFVETFEKNVIVFINIRPHNVTPIFPKISVR